MPPSWFSLFTSFITDILGFSCNFSDISESLLKGFPVNKFSKFGVAISNCNVFQIFSWMYLRIFLKFYHTCRIFCWFTSLLWVVMRFLTPVKSPTWFPFSLGVLSAVPVRLPMGSAFLTCVLRSFVISYQFGRLTILPGSWPKFLVDCLLFWVHNLL